MHFTVPSGNLKNKNELKKLKNLHDFFRAVWKMLLDLLVLKFENLDTVRQCGLRCLCFVEEIDDFAVRKGLFYVVVAKVNNCVPVSKSFSPNAIAENDLFLPV